MDLTTDNASTFSIHDDLSKALYLTIHQHIGTDIACTFNTGNDAEKKTVIMAGASPEGYAKLRQLEKTIQELSQGLAQIEEGLRKFEELEKARGVSYKDDPRRVTLLRIKIRDTATLAHSKEEAKQLRNLIESASGACVTVLRGTYPGAVIQIEDTKLLVQNYVKAAEFYKLQDKIKKRECS